MATIKSYTDLEQSRKLAEILPINSADMYYSALVEGVKDKTIIKGWEVATGTKKWKVSMNTVNTDSFSYRNGCIIPCWSLAALIGVLPEYTLKSNKFYEKVALWCQGISVECDEPVDVCVAMIEKLHEIKIL